MSDKCALLHQWFNSLERLHFPFNSEAIPQNGIYILFESGEKAHGGDRIVRVGTHTGNDNLPSRLTEHFLTENKDRSIFRKHIGRCILSKDDDPFLASWELDLTKREAKDKFAGKIDFQKQEEIEERVSDIIHERFSFVVFRVDNKEKRMQLESRIISTVSWCDECGPSNKWLGLFCPNIKFQTKRVYNNCLKIQKSGLWLVKELYKEPLSDEDTKELESILRTK